MADASTNTTTIIITAAVIAFLLFFAFRGYRRGMLRILFSTFSLIVVIALSSILITPVSNWIHEKTFIGTNVDKQVSEFVDKKLSQAAGTASENDAASGQSIAQADNINSGDAKLSEAEPEKEVQEDIISSLALPEFLKDSFIKDNTLDSYIKLQVKNFKEYISVRLSDTIIRAITYILLIIVLAILVRIIVKLLKFLDHLPVIGGINRFFGLFFGLAEGLLILWIICLILMALSGTEFGSGIIETIRKSAFLSFIYDNNLIVTGAKTLWSSIT